MRKALTGSAARLCALVACVVLLLGCTAPDNPAGPGVAPSTESSATAVPTTQAPVVSAHVDANKPYPRRSTLKSLLPSRIGEATGVGPATPSLLDDPPGQAVAVYFPEKPLDRRGWGDVTLYFLGIDGSWTRLNMGDLGLPAATWPGTDTYGGGELSADGRWWVGRAFDGAVLVDLGTGETKFVRFPEGGNATAFVWSPDARFVVAYNSYRNRTHRINIPSGRLASFPYPLYQGRGDSLADLLEPDRWLVVNEKEETLRILTPQGREVSDIVINDDDEFIPFRVSDELVFAFSRRTRGPERGYDRATGDLRYELTQKLLTVKRGDPKGYPASLRFYLEHRNAVVFQMENRLMLWHLKDGTVSRVTSWVPDTKLEYLASDIEVIPLAFCPVKPACSGAPE